jgi:hypothetical protein
MTLEGKVVAGFLVELISSGAGSETHDDSESSTYLGSDSVRIGRSMGSKALTGWPRDLQHFLLQIHCSEKL